MSTLKTMTPIASVLMLSLAAVAHAEPTKVPGNPAAATQTAKPAKPMEGKCGAGSKMGEGKCGAGAKKQ